MNIEHLDDTWISEDGDDLLGVQVNEETPHQHSVFVNVLEFVHEEPLESRVRAAIAEALRSVPGVELATEDEPTTWEVTGEASGDALIRSVATVLEGLADELRPHVPPARADLLD